MATKSKKGNSDLDITKLVMGRLAAMPHKPHVVKKKTAAAKPKKRAVK